MVNGYNDRNACTFRNIYYIDSIYERRCIFMYDDNSYIGSTIEPIGMPEGMPTTTIDSAND